MTTKDRAKEEARRLADYAGTSTIYEGDVIPVSELENEELTVLAFNFAKSTYREGENFLSMQCERGKGKSKVLIVVNTNAQVLMKGFLNVPKDVLPLPVVFYMEKPKGGGRPYWNMR